MQQNKEEQTSEEKADKIIKLNKKLNTLNLSLKGIYELSKKEQENADTADKKAPTK